MGTVSIPRDISAAMEQSHPGKWCRDCFVPPGALGITLHSTAQGPIVHSVKESSRLREHVSPGDLVIAVEDVDTKSHRAEDVMQMLMARRGHRRKITVLSDRNFVQP